MLPYSLVLFAALLVLHCHSLLCSGYWDKVIGSGAVASARCNNNKGNASLGVAPLRALNTKSIHSRGMWHAACGMRHAAQCLLQLLACWPVAPLACCLLPVN